MKVYFVILHYESYEDTVECVESILKNVLYKDFKIIIVDNCSPNKSGEYLKGIYQTDSRVDIILNSANIGFAKGNNVGFKKAKQNNADFIIQLNNDTIIQDGMLIDKMIDIYKETGYGVMGPDILSIKDNRHQNPYPAFIVNKKNLRKKLLKNKIGLALNVLGLDVIFEKTKKGFLYDRPYATESWIKNDGGYVLQGSCLIFSPLYISAFDGMFEGTFMYYEEHILSYLCMKKGIAMLYSPRIQILHKEGTATSTVARKKRSKRMFVYKQSIKSIIAFISLLEGN